MEENVSLKEYKEILFTVRGIKSAVKKVPMFHDRKEEIMAAESHEMFCNSIRLLLMV